MRVLLTGGTGFIGAAAARALSGRGHALRVLVRDPARYHGPPAEAWRGSLQDPASLRGIAAGLDGVLHLAGLIAARSESEFLEVNARGSALLAAEVQRDAPAARFVQVSSLAATGPGDPVSDDTPPQPVSAYGRSKLAGERALAQVGLANYVVVRPPAVYGPGDQAFLPFFRAAAARRPVPLPAGRLQRISLVHVHDLVDALLAALETPGLRCGAVYHVAHPQALRPEQLLEQIGAATGGRGRVVRVPVALPWALAGLLSPLRRLTGWPRYLSLDKLREFTAPAWHCDAAGARRDLRWSARRDFASGLAETVAEYRRAGLLRLDGAGAKG